MTQCPQDLINCPGYNFPVHRYPQNGCGCPPPNSPVISIGAVLPNKQDILFANSNLFTTNGRSVRSNRVYNIAANQDTAFIRNDTEAVFRKPYISAPKVSRYYPNIGLDNAQAKTSVTFATNGGTESRIPNDSVERAPAIIDDTLLEPNIDYFFPRDVCTLQPQPSPSVSPSIPPSTPPSVLPSIFPSQSVPIIYPPSPSITVTYSPSPSIPVIYPPSPSIPVIYPPSISPSVYYPYVSPSTSPYYQQPSPSTSVNVSQPYASPSPQPSGGCSSDTDCCICRASASCGQNCGECSCPPGTICKVTDDILTPAGCFEEHIVDCNIVTNNTDCLNTFGPSLTGGYWTYVSGHCCNGNCQEAPC